MILGGAFPFSCARCGKEFSIGLRALIAGFPKKARLRFYVRARLSNMQRANSHSSSTYVFYGVRLLRMYVRMYWSRTLSETG